MKLTIFSRLVIGYLTILILLIGLSVYTIVRMGKLSEITHSLLMTNNRMNEVMEKLADIALSQVRYEKKFIITRDQAFYTQFLRLKKDFDQYAGEAMAIAGSSQVKDILDRAGVSYRDYQTLFEIEVKHLRASDRYPQQQYKEEKESAVNGLLEALERVKDSYQQETNKKIEEVYAAGAQARKMAMAMVGGFLLFGILLSFFIQRSITRPISVIMKKTREIAEGNCEPNLQLSSPPEVGELARALNFMCNKLQQLDRMKSDFFSSVSHELRTPLSTIRMGIRLLMDKSKGTLADEEKKLLAILDQESARLINQVNSLLDLSKMEAGMMTYHLEERKLSPLIEKAIEEIRPLAESKRINLESEMTEVLPVLKVDFERILQALRNLIGNAVKFTPEGGRVTITALPSQEGVKVSVADTGPGIPAESLSTIFNKFQQETSAGTHRMKGTGLGLALVKEIITSHGGRVWAESKPGQGSTFIFVLPA